MPKAGEIAAELRRIADSLDIEPEASLPQPMLSFYCNDYVALDRGKAAFLATVRLLPKPLQKELDETKYEIGYGRRQNVPIWLRSTIKRSSVCRLVKAAQAAVYDCEPLLSAEEEANLPSGTDLHALAAHQTARERTAGGA